MDIMEDRKDIAFAILVVWGVLYLAADLWLYRVSGLSIRDAALIDVPITLAFVIVAVIIYSKRHEAAGYWPQPPRH